MTSQEYQRLIQRIRSVVGQHVQPGSRILVVSRGDHQLLALGDREAWHFPRDDAGAWAGYHPGTDREAIAQLEAGRRDGADYILFPATALWWFDHYAAFRAHLSGNYRLVHDEPDVCRIYGLSGRGTERARASRAESVSGVRARAGLPRFLDALLPERAGVAVLSDLAIESTELGGRPTCRAGASASGIPAILAELDELRSQGWEFAAVLAPSPRPNGRITQLATAVGQSYRRVAHRAGIGWLFDLSVRAEGDRGPA